MGQVFVRRVRRWFDVIRCHVILAAMKRDRRVVFIGWLLCLGILCGVSGCKRPSSAPKMRVVDIQIASQTDDTAAKQGAPQALDPEPLIAAATAGLRAADVPVMLSATDRQPGDFVLQIETGLVYATGHELKSKQPLLRVLTAGLLRTRRGIDVMSDDSTQQPELTRLQHLAVSEQAERVKPPTDMQWRDLARRAIEDTAHSLGAQLRLSGVPSKDLIALISNGKKEADLRGVALKILAQRKEAGVQPLAMAVLKDKHSPTALRDQAIGALVELGDPKTVRPMLDSTEFRDHSELGKVLEAVAALGGDEAQRYLEFVSQSHSDARIREEAKAALSHLLTRQAKKDAATSESGI